MSDTPTYDQLSALCAQMAAALNAWMVFSNADDPSYKARWEVRGRVDTAAALTAYRTLSPDPVWQRVPEEMTTAITDLTDAVSFYEKVQGASEDERIAVGQDHFNWLKRAAFKVATLNRARGEG